MYRRIKFRHLDAFSAIARAQFQDRCRTVDPDPTGDFKNLEGVGEYPRGRGDGA